MPAAPVKHRTVLYTQVLSLQSSFTPASCAVLSLIREVNRSPVSALMASVLKMYAHDKSTEGNSQLMLTNRVVAYQEEQRAV